MEPILESPDTGVRNPTARRSRVKAAIAAVIIAGALSSWGVVSVFAASPTPSAAASSGATASGAPSTGTTGHTCPAHTSASGSSS
jgi:hypothetical protein